MFTGKTCLVRRFTQGLFPPGQGATIGVDFMIKTVVVDNEKIKVNYHMLIPRNMYTINKLQSWNIAPDLGHSGPREISFHYSEVRDSFEFNERQN